MNKISILSLSLISSLFFSLDAVNANEELSLKDNLQGITNFELKAEKADDCPFGGNNDYYNREILSYLNTKNIPVIANSTQSSYPRLGLSISCFDANDNIVYSLELYIIQDLKLNERKNKVIVYDKGSFGIASYRTYNQREKEAVVEILDFFISEWKSVN